MDKLWNRTLLLVIILLTIGIGQSKLQGQVVLYMEIMTEDKPIKYYEGPVLMYKHVDYPDEWQREKITRILDEEKIIIFEGGMVNLDEIIMIRRTRGWATTLGYMLQTFGVAWLGFGVVGELAFGNVNIGVDTVVIGATSFGGGWLIRKLFKFKNYKIGKKVRLKILDVSWPEPRG